MLLTILVAIAMQSGADLTREIEFYNPDWSPDSRSIVFESTLDGKFSIYVISRDGSGLRRLTTDSSNNEQPRWSPDGRRIVFSSDRAGHLDLYVMNADGSNLTRRTTTPSGGYYQASFSPDGRWILFQGRSDTRETRDHVYVIPSDGSGSWRLLSDSTYGAQGPHWSKDGRSVTFSQVAWPKRFWNEMTLETMAAARRETKAVTVRLDGTVISSRPDPQSTTPPDEKITSPDGRYDAYTKAVDGFQGLYVGDRLILGGPAAGPLGYLRSTSLTPTVDTIDTFTSEIGGAPQRGSGTYVIHVIRFARGGRWEIVDNWYDSTGHETARQSTLTAPRRLMTEIETVRADGDSASMLITRDHVTAWVVPSGAGGTPRLYDGAAVGERYTGAAVAAAIAKTRGAIGSTFQYPAYTLFGGSPVPSRVDSIRIVGRDTLRGATPLPVVVLQRSNGGQLWMDETTGNEIASRGSAGPGRWWWHVRRGVTPPPASPTP